MPTDNSCQTDEPFWIIGIYKMEKQTEIWKDIPNYKGLYQVSNFGNVKSLRRLVNGKIDKIIVKERILKKHLSSNNYYSVTLSKNSIVKTYLIHQLVAMAFLNHVRNGYNIVVDHVNSIKTDNRLENLQLISHRQNISKDRKGGTSKYVGVSYFKRDDKWRAGIQINGKNISLGHFKEEYQAHLAYQKALKNIH